MASSGSQDDKERSLLALIANSDRDALTELYGRYHARLFKFVFRLSRSYSEADELVNDVMLAVWKNAAKFRGDSKPSTWIFGIAYRQALKRLSRKNLAVTTTDINDIPDDRLRSIEHEDWVRNALETLPPAQRITMELVFYLGLSYEEVARVTECPVSTVKTRMFYARRKLKAHLRLSETGTTPSGEHQ